MGFLTNSHGVHGFLNELHPCIALLLGAGVYLQHLRFLACRDEEQAFLLVGHLPHNEFLQRDDCGPLVLKDTRTRCSYLEKLRCKHEETLLADVLQAKLWA